MGGGGGGGLGKFALIKSFLYKKKSFWGYAVRKIAGSTPF